MYMRRHLQLKSLRSAITLVLGAGTLCAGLSVAHADPELRVGEVSLVLGKAYVLSPGEKPRQLKAGAQIGVLDQIMTEANGHVHIRFVDNALVSVRPDSRLEILNYQYDAGNPEASSVKLNLLEGVTRAISGDAAKSARERFRMNTPIAAIGVRGTDFVVSASEQAVRALVNEGSIVMAPYSSECLQSAFGPCASNAVELSQSSMRVVEIADNASLPRLVLIPEDGVNAQREPVELVESESDDKAEEAEVYSETVASRRVNEVTSTVTVSSGPVDKPPVVVEPLAVDFTPEVSVTASALTQRQLVWGRWSEEGGLGAAERITLSREVAKQDRAITVGDLTYALYRAEDGSKSVRPDLSVVRFDLSSAQAFYHSDSGVTTMAVNGGSLELDFIGRSFSTNLNLNSDTTGAVSFGAAGRINGGGTFFSITDTQRMAGAVSIDGTEAGYFFEKQVSDGTVQGLTLWDAK
jgi:hypothetical protein